MPRRINVLFAANKGYAPYLSAALTSVRHNLDRGVSLRVTILSRDLEVHDIGWPNQRDRDEIRCVAPLIPPGAVTPIRATDHVSVETYFRLFLDTVFEATADRVIYLDSDLVVLSDISRLYELNLQGKTAAAALDLYVRNWSNISTPGFQEPDADRIPYFNAGVMVIDLEAWRRRHVRQQALTFLERSQDDVLYWDQDALNYVLRGDWLELDPRWNRTRHYWQQLETGTLPFPPVVLSSLKRPFIVHFVTSSKPWQEYRHPDRRVYDRYVKMAGFHRERITFFGALTRKLGSMWSKSIKRAPPASM